MKSFEKVSSTLNISEEDAQELLKTATEYANEGKGLVLSNDKTADEVAILFGEKPVWLSAELNEKVGWQFSQAVYGLRKRGWSIKTLALGRRMFAYGLVSRPV